MQIISWLLLIAVLVIAVVFYFRTAGSVLDDEASPMPARRRVVLIGYLLFLGSGLVFMLVSLNLLDFPEEPLMSVQSLPRPYPIVRRQPERVGESGSQTSTTLNPSETTYPAPDNAPLLLRVFPQSIGSTSNISLTLYGRNFTPKSKVRLNGEPVPIEYVSEDLIMTRPELSQLRGVGSIMLEVENPDGFLSNALRVSVDKPTVKLNVFFLAYPLITREGQLLLLVVFAGALGSLFQATKTIADNINTRALGASSFWWYVTKPLLGVWLALIVYSVVRGGFMAGTPGESKVLNPFGVLAVAALVGMFADKAAQKLNDVFDVIVTVKEGNGDRLTQRTDRPIKNVRMLDNAPVIDKLEPDTVTAGTAGPYVVKVKGERLGKVSSVRLNGNDRRPDTVSEKQVTFTLTTEDMASAREINVIAVNSDGGVSAAARLTVSDSPEAGG